MKTTTGIVLALSLAAFAGSAFAQQTLKPEEMIKYRKAGYGFMSWNMGKIKAQVVDAPQNYNKEQVLAAARVVAATANSGMGALFAPGTDHEVNGEKTRVKPEFFQQQDEVRKHAMAFNKEANELAKVAESGDPAAIKVQFGKTGETCKNCHDKFRRD